MLGTGVQTIKGNNTLWHVVKGRVLSTKEGELMLQQGAGKAPELGPDR